MSVAGAFSRRSWTFQDKFPPCRGTVAVVQSLSHVQLFATPWTVACQASLSVTISLSLLKLMSIQSVMPSNYLILCHPLLLLPSIIFSIRDFSNELAPCIRWPKYWSFSFSISPSNEYSGLISFKVDQFDLLATIFLVGDSSPRDSQEYSPAPYFKSINSLVLSLPYGPILIPIHDYWKTITEELSMSFTPVRLCIFWYPNSYNGTAFLQCYP